MGGGPRLEEREVALAVAARQVVAAALQAQRAVVGEAERSVGAVELLFDDERAAGQLREGNRRQILVAGLQSRALQMRRARELKHAPP